MCPNERPGFEAIATGWKELGTCVLPRPGFDRMEGARSMCPTERPGYEAKTTGRKELGACVLPRALGSRLKPQEGRS